MEKDYILNILSTSIIDEVPLLVIGFDINGEILYWNKKAREITGYSKQEAIQRGLPLFLRIFLGEKDRIMRFSRNANLFGAILSGERSLKNEETSLESKNGVLRHIKWDSFLVKGKSGDAPEMVIVTGIDVTFNHILQSTLREKIKYIHTTTNRLRRYISLDPSTGLVNYRHFMHKLNSTFYDFFGKNRPLSLLLMDIDYFCSINSIHGVSRGNQILRKVANIIKSNIDRNFMAARFSGTEFAVMMPGVDIKTSFKISERLLSVLTDHDFGIYSNGDNISLSLRMALGGCPHCEDVFTPEQLLDRVVLKLREAKGAGTNSVLICSPNEGFQEYPQEQKDGAGEADDGVYYKYTVEFVNALANAVKTKDLYTQEHSASMSNYAAYMADFIGLSAEDVQSIRFGAILHDIGKIGIDKLILRKPGALTKTEFRTIQQHPRIGAEIIRNVHPLKKVVPLVLYHHERFDGTGYLNGLKGEEIPIGARIVSLADVFQALTSDRPYRKALPENDACDIIKSYSGKYFDPKVVKAFFEVYRSCAA